ncbi:MAG TPA: hypothetical protein DCR93_33245 [Cytophagales bacterium]|nr:hypothetical protein [Cytophagales bacterium]HAP64148.1 hypothetical protein [Cytophagales bacterium]
MGVINHELGDIDASHPNKVLNTMKHGDFSQKNIDSFVATVEGVLLSREDPYVVIYDNSALKWMTSQERIAAGKALGTLEPKLQDYYSGTITVITSPITRMISRGVTLVMKNKKPIVFVSSIEEAHKKADEFLSKVMVAS